MCNILLVEDDKLDARFISREITNNFKDNYIKIVTNEQDLDEFINAADFDNIEVVLTDYKIMPGFNGLTVLNKIREKNKDLPVLIVTGEIGEEKAAELMREGIDDFIIKDNLSRLTPMLSREIKKYQSKKNYDKATFLTHAILYKLNEIQRYILTTNIDKIDINFILTDLCETLEIDRAGIYQKINNTYSETYTYKRNMLPKFSPNSPHKTIQIKNNYKFIHEIENNMSYTELYDNLEDKDKKIFEDLNAKSIAFIPIIDINTNIWGFFSFYHIFKNSEWTNIEILALQLLSSQFTNVISKMSCS